MGLCFSHTRNTSEHLSKPESSKNASKQKQKQQQQESQRRIRTKKETKDIQRIRRKQSLKLVKNDKDESIPMATPDTISDRDKIKNHGEAIKQLHATMEFYKKHDMQIPIEIEQLLLKTHEESLEIVIT
ncbi:MAG: hypothetical protein ACTSUE_15195 [Promethearchaeota archaeon]